MVVRIGDVIRDLKTNAAFAILLGAAWILSSVSYENALRMREQTRDLVAFLLLRDAPTPLAKIDEAWPSRGDEVSCIRREIVVNRSETEVCDPIVVTAPWDSNLSARVTIVPHANAAVEGFAYSLRVDNPFLPFDRYIVGKMDRGRLRILQDLPYQSARNVADTMLMSDRTRELLRSPQHWSQLSVVLNALGSSATKVDDVKISDPSVGKLMTDYLSVQMVRESIAGLSVPIFLIPAGLSVLLLITSMLLIGDWAALRQARTSPPQEEFGWVMLHAGPSKGFRAVALAASVVLALALLTIPAVALERTIELMRHPLAHQSMLGLLATALIVAEVMLVATVVEQLRLRHQLVSANSTANVLRPA